VDQWDARYRSHWDDKTLRDTYDVHFTGGQRRTAGGLLGAVGWLARGITKSGGKIHLKSVCILYQ